MDNKLERKYGLFTAICMVVGIVIGSGVFFKAQVILEKTGGNMPLGILAWLIGGVIMLVCVLTFANMSQKYEKVNGIVDYAEATVGPKYGYLVGWFMTTIYYPTLTSVLAWLSARYTLVFLTSVNPSLPLVVPAEQGGCVVGPECIALMLFYLCCGYAVNALSPKLAGKLQTTATVIKFIPLTLMAVVGIVYGLTTGQLASNFANPALGYEVIGNPLFAAVCATAFAYEGWIIATSINAELKNAKRNLPIALVLGTLIIAVVYILYYIGLAGGASNSAVMESGEAGAKLAFETIFGKAAGVGLFVLVVISCLGTLNGLMLASTRGMYAVAVRGQGPKPRAFAEVSRYTNIPANSAIVGLLMCAFWLVFFYGANLVDQPWFGVIAFDSSELPIITIYAVYLPIFLRMMITEKNLHPFKRFVMPALSILSCIFMIVAAIFAHGMGVVWYLIVFVVFMLLAAPFYRKNPVK